MAVQNLRLEIFGRVQGVNLRWEIKNFCEGEGIKGYVMNTDDGRVLIVAQAELEKLKKLVLWLKSSPGFSKISSMKSDFSELKKESKRYNSFEIVREKEYLVDKGEALLNLGKYMIGKIKATNNKDKI